jgi:hypothetical protein
LLLPDDLGQKVVRLIAVQRGDVIASADPDIHCPDSGRVYVWRIFNVSTELRKLSEQRLIREEKMRGAHRVRYPVNVLLTCDLYPLRFIKTSLAMRSKDTICGHVNLKWRFPEHRP